MKNLAFGIFSILCLSVMCFTTNAQSLEGGGGNTVECFSQSYTQEDFDYYDCGTCEKEDGRRGYGNTRLCTT